MHIQQSARNERIASLLAASSTPESRQWHVVGLFYAALHLCEAYFATGSIHNRSHEARDIAMSRLSILRPILTAYRQLRSDSESIRYGGHIPNSAQVQQDVRFFNEIAAYIRSNLPQT